GRVDLLLVGALRRYFEELDAFDLQLLRQDEGDPPVPGQAELSGPLAARDVGAYILAVERMAPVADDGLRRLPRLQLEVLLDRERAGGVGLHQPGCHAGAR